MLPIHSTDSMNKRLKANALTNQAPKIMVLYGSLRADAYSRLLAEQVVEFLQHFGAEVRLFDPAELPLFDGENQDHPKVQQLREWSSWSEGQVWISPEIHGNMSAVFKNQIDWLPLDQTAVRATQGKTLAVMQITGGSQSFNVVNNLRILGRWMRMFTIPNQSSIAKAWQEFDDQGRLKDSAFRDRVIDVLEELVKTTLLMRDQSDYLTERYSEKKTRLESVSAADDATENTNTKEALTTLTAACGLQSTDDTCCKPACC